MDKKKFSPIKVKLEKGKIYHWCQCGLSKSQPFCDGSHDGYFCEPKLVTVKEDTEKFLCTCKKTKNAPYCDGTHKEVNKAQ